MSTKHHILLITLLVLSMFGCSPNEKSVWYKGNLHTHTYWSDGDAFPEMVLDWYKSNGYEFISLTDHNILQQGEKWKKIPKSNIYQTAFQEYLEKYGEEWVEYREDSSGTHVKLKTEEEYLPLFADEHFMIMRGEEITDGFEGKPLHMNATNVQELIEPRHGESVAETLQNNIDAVLEQRQVTGQPVMPHINHPNFGWGISVDDMKALRGERFFEVFNGHPFVRNYGDSVHLSTEEMWDQINVAYFKRGQPLMYGIATDDSHHYHQFGPLFSNSGRGWVMVKAEKLEPNTIVEAMEAGQFYASTGVVLNELYQSDGRIKFEIDNEEGIEYTTEIIGIKKGDSRAEIIMVLTGTQISFDLGEEFLFARARITSSKLKDNPFKKGDYEMAWTQPITH